MDESLAKLRARSEVYRLLALAYHRPDDSLLEGDFRDRLGGALAVLGPGSYGAELKNLERYSQTLAETLELAVEYTRLFRGPVRAEVYPYEAMYAGGEIMGRSAMDVMTRYAKAGVVLSGDFNDLPDHISVELEFMHYLCAQESDALSRGEADKAPRFRLMAQRFFQDHLAHWVPEFCDRVIRYATTPFYLSLARITREFIGRESTAVGGRSQPR